MSHLLSRRAFSTGLALSIPATLSGSFAFAQPVVSVHDPNGTGLDLESVFLRIDPFDVRDMLMATPFESMGMAQGGLFEPHRWEDLSTGPYFSSVGGINILSAGGDIIGAYSVYLAPAGARAGMYLGRRALEDSTTEIVATEVAGYAAEVLIYGDGRELTQTAVGNVAVLGYDVGTDEQAAGEHPSMANAEVLITHLRHIFEATR